MINFITKNCSIWYTELRPNTEGNERRLQRRPLVSYLLNLLNGVKSLAYREFWRCIQKQVVVICFPSVQW